MKIERRRVQKHFKGKSRTKQAFKHESDINNILKKYNISQLAKHVNAIGGNYGDFSNVTDFQSSINAVMEAQENFDGLPAQTRKIFNNDPAQLIDFMSDNKNYDKAAELGLLSDEKNQEWRTKKLEKEALKNDDQTTKKDTSQN